MEELNNDTEMREWIFQVEGETAPGEVMCIVGSCEELGEWKPERVVLFQSIFGLHYQISSTFAIAQIFDDKFRHLIVICSHIKEY